MSRVKKEKSFNSLNKAVSLFLLYWWIDTYIHTYPCNKNNIFICFIIGKERGKSWRFPKCLEGQERKEPPLRVGLNGQMGGKIKVIFRYSLGASLVQYNE